MKSGQILVINVVLVPEPELMRRQLARKLGKENHALHTFGQAELSQPLEPASHDPDEDIGTSHYDRRMRRVFDFGKAHGVPRERMHIHEGNLVSGLEEMSEPMKGRGRVH